MNKDNLTPEERSELAEEAQGLLEEAIDLLKQAVRGTNIEERATRYTIAALEMLKDSHHEWLGSNYTVAEIADDLLELDED